MKPTRSLRLWLAVAVAFFLLAPMASAEAVICWGGVGDPGNSAHTNDALDRSVVIEPRRIHGSRPAHVESLRDGVGWRGLAEEFST